MRNQKPEYTYCTFCHTQYPIDALFPLEAEYLCPSCRKQHLLYCDHCGAAFWNTNNAGSTSIPLCQDCYNEHYCRCERCGDLLAQDEACYDNQSDRDYCEDCFEQIRENHIHDYSYKPNPIFYGDGDRYFGLELEIDGAGRDADKARQLLAVANAEHEHVYIKTDSSLEDGLELVTHSCTLSYHQTKLPWEGLAAKASSLGYLSHKTATCGLHIHVNRTAFSSDCERQEDCIGRILFFIEKHWGELLKFSRRTEAQLSRWASKYGLKSTPKDVLHHAKRGSEGRYTCLNLQNWNTIEFRIFRGTLRYNTMIASLQLVDEICRLALLLSDEAMTDLSWTNFVEGIQAEELITYLKERRLYLNEPVCAEEEI